MKTPEKFFSQKHIEILKEFHIEVSDLVNVVIGDKHSCDPFPIECWIEARGEEIIFTDLIHRQQLLFMERINAQYQAELVCKYKGISIWREIEEDKLTQFLYPYEREDFRVDKIGSSHYVCRTQFAGSLLFNSYLLDNKGNQWSTNSKKEAVDKVDELQTFRNLLEADLLGSNTLKVGFSEWESLSRSDSEDVLKLEWEEYWQWQMRGEQNKRSLKIEII